MQQLKLAAPQKPNTKTCNDRSVFAVSKDCPGQSTKGTEGLHLARITQGEASEASVSPDAQRLPTVYCPDSRLVSSFQTKDQLAGGVDYLKKLGDKSPDWSAFEVASGIGIEVRNILLQPEVLEMYHLQSKLSEISDEIPINRGQCRLICSTNSRLYSSPFTKSGIHVWLAGDTS